MSLPLIASYEVGWICALTQELAAARAMLDEDYGVLRQQEIGDNNTYIGGRIHQHNVVVACLPAGIYGTCPAAIVAQNMIRTFPQIRIGLLVGIGGGIPNLEKGIDIRLGDVVVSQPDGEHGGVIQYTKGKLQENTNATNLIFTRKGSLNKPPSLLLTALNVLQAHHEVDEGKMSVYLEEMLRQKPKMKKTGYSFPGTEHDDLYSSLPTDERSTYKDEQSYDASKSKYAKVSRPLRVDDEPAIHYGSIASGDFVVKNAMARDMLRDELGAKCVETEAAGLQDTFPCLVIRGVSDYADSFKNDLWQRYAAATAAAYAKEFLLYVSPQQVHQGQTAQEIMGQINETLQEGNRLRKEALEENRTQFQRLEARVQTQYERSCLQVFKTSHYQRFRDINPDRVAGTCRWVLDHSHFRQWYRSSHNDLLWISADPGCGKSVLARSLVTCELADLQQSTTCYYFFKDNERQDRLVPALCAVLHQLFNDQPDLLHHAVLAWEKNGDKVREEVSTMWQILLDAVADEKARDVVCVFDALDECHNDDRRELVTRLCQFHEQRSKVVYRATLKFLVTSRPYDSVQRWFEQTVSRLPQVRLRGEDENDRIRGEINLVIDRQIEDLAIDFSLSAQHQNRLRQRLQEMEHRTYLWLYLAMKEIRDKYRNSPDPEEELIDHLPTSVENAYEQILQNITDSQRPHARKILLIIVSARRPLSIGEASLALNADAAYEKGHSVVKDSNIAHLESRIRDWCGLFVFINHSQLFLIHQTAKEFLLTDLVTCNTEASSWKSSLLTSHVELEMATICITYLYLTAMERRSSDQFSGGSVTRSSFFRYCAEQWTLHFDDRNITDNEKLLNMVIELYDTAHERFHNWFPIMWTRSSYHQNAPRLYDQHAMAMSGHAEILGEKYKRRAFDLNLQDSSGRTALIWAAETGHADAVRMLLNKGADIDTERGGSYGNALRAASDGGHDEVTQILIDAGADVNGQGDRYGNIIRAASQRGHDKVVQILVNAGADVNVQGERYGNVLQAAAERGYERVVQILLKAGADVNAEGGGNENALQAASKNGHARVVQILLEAGANINSQGDSGNALRMASLGGHGNVVQILLEARADLKGPGDYGDALLIASEHGREEVVQLLLNAGAEPNARGRSRNALEVASSMGHERLVQILIDAGADVNVQGGRLYGNALQAASSGGHEKVVQVLLRAGADIDGQEDHINVLQAAALCGHKGVVKILLEAGAQVDSHGGLYGYALQAASSGGHREVVQILLEGGANVNASGGLYGSAVQAALSCDHKEVVQILLEAGATNPRAANK